jgi:hypothetical protein
MGIAVTVHRSEMPRESGLLQDGVCRVARFDVVVHSEAHFGDRAFPDFIASARPDKPASSGFQNFLKGWCKAIHVPCGQTEFGQRSKIGHSLFC